MYIRGKYTSSAQVIDFNLSGVIVYTTPQRLLCMCIVFCCVYGVIYIPSFLVKGVVEYPVHHLPNKANLAL